jgi:hypothetical protein
MDFLLHRLYYFLVFEFFTFYDKMEIDEYMVFPLPEHVDSELSKLYSVMPKEDEETGML